LRVFNSVRRKNLEQLSDNKVILEMDQYGTFDYDEGTDLVYKSISQMREAILNDVKLFKEQQFKKINNLRALNS